MLIRKPPSLKRYLIWVASTLRKIREASEPQWDYELSVFEELVIVLEDRRYLRHHGLDWRSFLREVSKALARRKHGGASTIEMQYVRTVSNRYERTLRRKIDEAILAFLLNYHLDKITILRSYLAIAYFGTGVWGAEDGARAICGRDLSDLDYEESARLAAALVYPKPRAPTARWEQNVERRAKYGIALHRRLYKSLHDLSVS